MAFYGRIFELSLRGRAPGMAFIDIGDQFIALSEGRKQAPDDGRHFGLMVDDQEAARRALEDAGAEVLPGPGLDFVDPWGNRVQVVEYADIQLTREAGVLAGMGLADLRKSEAALTELEGKGLRPRSPGAASP